MTPRRLGGRFRLISLAGNGASGDVYRSRGVRSVGCVEDFDILAYVTLAEALLANGEAVSAREVLHGARERLEVRLNGIEDPALRAGFVERVPDHARVYELCRLTDEGRPDIGVG